MSAAEPHWPLSLSPTQMLDLSAQHRLGVTSKTIMIMFDGEPPATYVLHKDEWLLLDAARHGHA